MPEQTKPAYTCLVSACLCGVACRYDGAPATVPGLEALQREGLALAVCPEVLGGLGVPRSPCEIKDGRVLTRAGEDVTEAFHLGAQKTLELARKFGITKAVLKERSPSCGSSIIYDGSFSGGRIPGEGVTAALLRRAGLTVINERAED